MPRSKFKTATHPRVHTGDGKPTSDHELSGKGVNLLDGWQNLLTGLGVTRADKRLHTTYVKTGALDELTLEGLYRSGGIAARIIDILTEDMTRKGFTITGDTDNSIMKEFKKFRGIPMVIEAVRWANLYGGALGVLGIEDGGMYDEEVNENNIQAVTHIHVFDRWRTAWTSQDLYNNEMNPKYGTPQFYTIYPINPLSGYGTPPSGGKIIPTNSANAVVTNFPKGTASPNVSSFKVHESRILRFNGRQIPLRSRIENRYWDDSILQPVYENLRGVGEAISGIEGIVSEFVLGILRMNNLQAMIAGGKEDWVRQRLLLMDMTKHMKNTVVLDTNEEFQRITASTTGLADLIDRLLNVISAVTGIPVTILMGQAPAGLNATGQADLRRYYDKVEACQQWMLLEPMEKLCRYIILSKNARIKGVTAEDFELKFNPLHALTESETAELRVQMAQADAAYVNAKILMPNEVTQSRFGGDSFSMETKLDATRSEDGRLSTKDEEKMNPVPVVPSQKESFTPAKGNQKPLSIGEKP